MKYYIWILGCQYNEWDGARIKYALSGLGLEESDAKSADIVIILSCSVRQTAIDRILGRVKNWKKKKIYLTGCVLEADRKKFEVKNIEIIEQGNVEELISKISKLSDSELPTSYQLTTNSCNLVPIMIGCNNFCAYCAVPYTRGREKSRDFDEIVSDVKLLINKYCSNPVGENSHNKNFSQGSKNKPFEIILLGQNVNSFIIDKSKIKSQNCNLKVKNLIQKKDFTLLLETLNELPGDFIISFTSNHPKDMSEDIIHAVTELSKIKKAIHLPLQSGSDKILKAMNRPYTIEKYLDIIKKIKETCPKIEISTDVIVGFPGETEDEFQETVAVLKQVKFTQVFINKYSPRQGTKAYELGDPVSWEEKQRRWNVLNDIAYHKKY